MFLYFILGLLSGLLIGAIVFFVVYSNKKAELSVAQNELSILRTQSALQEEARTQQFAQQLALVKSSLENTTQRMLDESRQRLSERNKQEVSDLTQPLREAIREMRNEMMSNNREATRQAAGLTAEIKNLAEASQKVSDRAQMLAIALRNDVKKQGNWGELVLTNLLEREGLKEGVEFDTQVKLQDALGKTLVNETTGQSMFPDAIVHYPNNQDVIVDAKVSLKAYMDYLQAPDDETREAALKAHVHSLREQFLRLSKKNYAAYILPPRRAIEFVVMFVPNEGALQLALSADASLWYDAFDRRVLIAGEHNLAAILRIISIAWRQFKQAENQQRVFRVATELLDRLGDFAQRYTKLGEHIDRLRNQYEETSKKLTTGRQSVFKKGTELKELGVPDNPNRPLPSPTIDAEDLIEIEPDE